MILKTHFQIDPLWDQIIYIFLRIVSDTKNHFSVWHLLCLCCHDSKYAILNLDSTSKSNFSLWYLYSDLKNKVEDYKPHCILQGAVGVLWNCPAQNFLQQITYYRYYFRNLEIVLTWLIKNTTSFQTYGIFQGPAWSFFYSHFSSLLTALYPGKSFCLRGVPS